MRADRRQSAEDLFQKIKWASTLRNTRDSYSVEDWTYLEKDADFDRLLGEVNEFSLALTTEERDEALVILRSIWAHDE